MASAFNGQLYDQVIVDIVTERKYPLIYMRSLTQIRKEVYIMEPTDSTRNVHLFVRVTRRDMAGLMRNWKMTTPRGMITTLKTWSRHASSLMNKMTGIQY